MMHLDCIIRMFIAVAAPFKSALSDFHKTGSHLRHILLLLGLCVRDDRVVEADAHVALVRRRYV